METDFVRNACGFGWHIDRNRFDWMLCQEAASAGATMLLHRTLNWKRTRHGWQANDLVARFLVNASGRHGISLDGQSGRQREDALLAVVFRIRPPVGDTDQRTWIESAPAGWWYSVHLPSGVGLVMFFTCAQIYRQNGICVGEQLEFAPLTRERLRHGNVPAERIVYVPSGISTNLLGKSWLAVGDSASSYDPLCGRGIFKAFRHGEAAAQTVDSWLRGDAAAMDTYVSQVRADFEAYAKQRFFFYAGEQRWASHPFWRIRHLEPPGTADGAALRT